MKSLRTRMFLLILAPILISLAGLTIYIYVHVHNMTVDDANELLLAEGEALAKDLKHELEQGAIATRTLAQSFQAIIASRRTPSREDANSMLVEVLENNPNFIATWMYWEENAFDGKDAEYANTKGHDASGRFVPVWSKGDSGYVVEPLAGYEEGFMKEQLNIPLISGRTALYEPYEYDLGGESLLVTS